MVIFPTYGAVWGTSAATATGSNATARPIGLAGEVTTPVTAIEGVPLEGVLNVSHLAPAVAVNEIGSPSVESVTICEVVVPGAAKVTLVQLKERFAGGAVTVNVTGIFTGAATPATLIVTKALL